MQSLSTKVFFKHKPAVFRPNDVVVGFVVIRWSMTETVGTLPEVELEWSGKVILTNKKRQSGSYLIFRTLQKLITNKSVMRRRYNEGQMEEVRIPFKQRLPLNLPSSYLGSTSGAEIYYKVESRCCYPPQDEEDAIVASRIFYVAMTTELTSKMMMEQSVTKRAGIACCCCLLPAFEVTMTLDKSGYVSGENILIKIEAKNGSRRDIIGVKLRLMQMTSIVCNAGYSYQRISVSQLDLSESKVVIPAQQTLVTLPTQSLTIPPVMPSSETGTTGLISVKYELQCFIEMPTFYTHLIMSQPITIGTYPIDLNLTLSKLHVLPADGEIVSQAPSSDLESPDFAKSIENIISNFDVASRKSDDEEDDSRHLSSNHQLSLHRKTSCETTVACRKKPKYIFYTYSNRQWTIHYGRHENIANVKNGLLDNDGVRTDRKDGENDILSY